MRTSETKKELAREYKERTIVGGIIAYENTVNGRIMLVSTQNVTSLKNRFDFSVSTGSCVTPKLQNDWSTHGKCAFTFTVLEELKRGETQTDKEFKCDLELLLDLWFEKLSDRDMY